HLKRKHSTLIGIPVSTTDDPDSDLQNIDSIDKVSNIQSSSTKYTKKLQPLYTPPSRKLLSTKLLPDQYNIIVSKLKSMLNNVNDVSITTDMWTSDSTKSYITVTCHFIYNDNLYSPVIATKEVCEITIVSDSEANIKNAINEHLKKYHHPCVAHTLNLSVNDAINKNTELFQMGLPELKVKQDVSTRWNSCLIMIERLIEIKNPISAAISMGFNSRFIAPILKPFEHMTSELSGEKYPTLSLVIPLIRGLQHTVKNIKPDTHADPRLKNTAFGLTDNAENIQKWIIEELTSNIYINNGDENNISETPTPPILTRESSSSLWEHFDSKLSQVRSVIRPDINATL
ncbi:zinc finger BED domain-containing protein 1-like, partial [Aphis craccivora]